MLTFRGLDTHIFGLRWVIARRRAYTRGCVSRDDESRLGGHVIRASMQSMLCCMRVVCHVSAFALGLVSTILIPGPHAMIGSVSMRPLFAIFTCEFLGLVGFKSPGYFGARLFFPARLNLASGPVSV